MNNKAVKKTKRTFSKAVVIAVTFIVAVFSVLPITAFAAEYPDFSRKGTICIDLKYKGTPIEGAEITAYKIAEATKEGNSVQFVFTDDFRDFAEDTSTLSESDSPESLVNFINDNSIRGTSTQTDRKGHGEFANLDLGIYLVAQENKLRGYSSITPFMAYLPFTKDGEYYYFINATPKTNVEKEPSTGITTTTKPLSSSTENLVSKPDTSKPVTGNTSTTRIYYTTNSVNTTAKETKPTYVYTTHRNSSTAPTVWPSTSRNIFTLTGSQIPNENISLIQTGHNQTIIPILAFAGLAVLVLGIFIYKNEEK